MLPAGSRCSGRRRSDARGSACRSGRLEGSPDSGGEQVPGAAPGRRRPWLSSGCITISWPSGDGRTMEPRCCGQEPRLVRRSVREATVSAIRERARSLLRRGARAHSRGCAVHRAGRGGRAALDQSLRPSRTRRIESGSPFSFSEIFIAPLALDCESPLGPMHERLGLSVGVPSGT